MWGRLRGCGRLINFVLTALSLLYASTTILGVSFGRQIYQLIVVFGKSICVKMDRGNVAAAADAFLAGLENQAAAEHLKQQEVNAFAPNEYASGDYESHNGHGMGYRTYGQGEAQAPWSQQQSYGQSVAYDQHQSNQSQDYSANGSEAAGGSIGGERGTNGYDGYIDMVGRGGSGYSQNNGASEFGTGISSNEECKHYNYGAAPVENHNAVEGENGGARGVNGEGGSDGNSDQNASAG